LAQSEPVSGTWVAVEYAAKDSLCGSYEIATQAGGVTRSSDGWLDHTEIRAGKLKSKSEGPSVIATLGSSSATLKMLARRPSV
jgi:hypothetical protein